MSIRAIASATSPRLSDATMNGNAAATFRSGTSHGTPITSAMPYDSAVAAMMASGAAAAFTATDYTDRRPRITRTGLGRGLHRPVRPRITRTGFATDYTEYTDP